MAQTQMQLIDPSKNVLGWIDSGGGFRSAAGYWCTEYIPVSPGEQLPFTMSNPTQATVWYDDTFFDANKVFLGGYEDHYSQAASISTTFTVPANAAYMRVSYTVNMEVSLVRSVNLLTSGSITLSAVVDVHSVTRYYLLQSSTLARPSKPTTNPPPAAWDDTEPTYTAGSTNSLYFTDLTVFSDGTWAYSEVSLSSSYEAAKEAYNLAQTAGSAAAQALSSTECIVGTQTATTNAWTGRASFSTLTNGQVILYWLPYAGTSSGATLNLTLSGGGTTGAKNVYINATTRCTSHIAAGNMVQMVYRAGVSIGTGTYTGWWISRALNDNTYDRIRFNNAITAKSTITAAYLIVGDNSGFFHLAASTAFDVNKPILFAGSAIAAAATGTNNYLSYPSINLRTTLGNSSWTATKGATVYLAGTLDGSTFTTRGEEWLTTTPTESTSVTYIALGFMYSTYQCYLYPEHPMYKMIGETLTSINQIAYEAQVAATTAQATAEAARADFRRVVRIDDDGLHVGDNQSTGEVLIDSESVNVVMNGNKYSRFAGNYVQFGNYQLRRTADGGLAFKMTDI